MRTTMRWLALLVMACFGFLTAGTAGAAQAGSEEGAKLYKTHCAMCHGADGTGQTTMGKRLNLRSLKSQEVQSMTDAQLEQIIAKGKGKMPGYEQKVGAAGVKQLVAYMRTFK